MLEPEVAETSTLAPLVAGEMAAIPSGTVFAGSTPGIAGRKPEREADSIAIELPAFEIDRLPYPNDPERDPLFGVDRSEAALLCEEQGKRLCTELEWERACEGESERPYPTGHVYRDQTCDPNLMECRSPFGGARMGSMGREWTMSRPRFGIEPGTGVTRGAPHDAAPGLSPMCLPSGDARRHAEWGGHLSAVAEAR